jgi:hypothetical protein
MIRSFTATTREVDDVQVATAEILNAINPERNLLKNSLGVISCFSEFAETGVLAAICEALPFDCIGATTCICSAGGQTDQILFAITVFTSDDCSFDTISIPVGENYDDSISNSLSKKLQNNDERPSLMLGYFPLINTISGDMLLTAIDKTTGGIPLFGTVAVDHKIDYSTAMTIHNGKGYREAVVLGMIYGPVNYSFEIASLNEDKIRKQRAIITSSDGNILISVNGKAALEYLEEIGLQREELLAGLGILPLVIDHKDGTKPIARAVFAITPNGNAVCGGAMPINATLAIGRVDMVDVLSTTEKNFKPMVERNCTVLSYSCIARYIALGVNQGAEAEKIADLARDMRYLFAISGGEMCPLFDASGNLKNYFHNYTNVFCKLS